VSRRTYGVLAIAQRHPRLFQALHRLLVLVTGMPDSMATKEMRHG
jgi:hypothetical protein